jgi:MFS family permease
MSSSTAGAILSSRFRALRHRNFRLFWLGQIISLVGTWMQSVAQGWLMHRLTDSAFMLGLLGFAQFLPIMLFSLWAGAIVDRVDKRKLIFLTQTLSLVQAVLLALLVSFAVVQPWMVLVLALVFGTISAFDLPARQSFLVEMVGIEDLSNAIALNSAAFNAARVFGPAVAGLVVAWVGESWCFWINALSFVAVLAMLMRMNTVSRIDDQAGRDALQNVLDGIRYVLRVHPLRNLLLLLGATAGLGFQYMILLPVYAKQILHAGAEAYGLMVSAFGIGSLFSAVVMTRQLDRWSLRRNLLVGLTVAGVGLLTFAWSRVLAWSLVGGVLCGFGLILYVASTNTLLQLTTEDRYRGRVMSLYTFMFIGTAPLGALASGWIAQHISAPVSTTMNATVLLAGAIWVAYRLRVLAGREAARPTEPVGVEKVG